MQEIIIILSFVAGIIFLLKSFYIIKFYNNIKNNDEIKQIYTKINTNKGEICKN